MKTRLWLAWLVIVCALLQITLVILDEFNPVLGFLTSTAPKLFLCAFSVLGVVLGIAVLKTGKK